MGWVCFPPPADQITLDTDDSVKRTRRSTVPVLGVLRLSVLATAAARIEPWVAIAEGKPESSVAFGMKQFGEHESEIPQHL